MSTSEKTKPDFAMGLCGKNLAWMLDDGVLTIAGEGEMESDYRTTQWLQFKNAVTSIVMEEGVTSIGSVAFRGCTGLTRVVIPDSVTSIGSYAFCSCTGLTSVEIPDSVTSIDSYAFASCASLTSVAIPNSVARIGIGAFECCIGLTSVVISDGVTSIGPSTFGDCTGLTSVTIPDSVREIGSSAFDRSCVNLTDVYYAGSKTDWDAVKIGVGNDALKNAAIQFGG